MYVGIIRFDTAEMGTMQSSFNLYIIQSWHYCYHSLFYHNLILII